MKSKLTFVLAFITILSLLIPTKVAAQDDVFPSGIPYSEIGAKIEAYVNEHKATTAGLAVAVYDSEHVIYQQTFGYEDIAAQRPVTADSVFEWGSVSKLVVWMSVMQLWEQGKIDLSADIRTYLPDGFLTRLKYDKPITMIHLMNHEAGFQETLVNIFSEDISTITTLEAALKDSEPPQVYQPGEYTAYSNWGTALAAFIVENISGSSFDQYAHQHIFTPLGMQTTAIKPDLSDNPEVQRRTKTMSCYDTAAKPLPACKFYIPMYPAGMITSTLEDFLKFAQALDPAGQTGKLLFRNPDTFKQLFEETNTYPETTYPRNAHGMWVEYYGIATYGHGGNTAGQSANLVMNPGVGVGMVVMTNQSAEKVDNSGLPELVFGKFEPEVERTLPTGFYQSMRTVVEGPLSLYKLGSLVTMEPADLTSFWTTRVHDGKDIMSYPVIDFVKVSALQLGIYVVFLLLVVVSLTGGLIAVLSGFIRAIRSRSPAVIAKEREEKPLLRWRRWAWVLLLIMVLLLAGLVFSGFTYQTRPVFLFIIGGFMLLFFVMAWHLLRLVGKFGLMRANAREKWRTSWVASLLVMAMGYMVYWQLYQFWNL